MKILKILLILLVPAIGFVGCKKSESHPCSNNTAASTNSDTNKINGKSVLISDDQDSGTNIVGSGDDDRDGGDKRKRR